MLPDWAKRWIGRSRLADWAMYQPIAEVVLNAGLDLAFGNEPRNFVRAAMVNGLTIIDAERLSELKLDVPLEANSQPIYAIRSLRAIATCCLKMWPHLWPMVSVCAMRSWPNKWL